MFGSSSQNFNILQTVRIPAIVSRPKIYLQPQGSNIQFRCTRSYTFNRKTIRTVSMAAAIQNATVTRHSQVYHGRVNWEHIGQTQLLDPPPTGPTYLSQPRRGAVAASAWPPRASTRAPHGFARPRSPGYCASITSMSDNMEKHSFCTGKLQFLAGLLFGLLLVFKKKKGFLFLTQQ